MDSVILLQSGDRRLLGFIKRDLMAAQPTVQGSKSTLSSSTSLPRITLWFFLFRHKYLFIYLFMHSNARPASQLQIDFQICYRNINPNIGRHVYLEHN